MLSENRVKELAITWYFLAKNAQHESAEKAAPIFAKAHAFIHVLDLPSDISCGKKSEDGLKRYVENLHNAWLEEYSKNVELVINEWLHLNIKPDFENHI